MRNVDKARELLSRYKSEESSESSSNSNQEQCTQPESITVEHLIRSTAEVERLKKEVNQLQRRISELELQVATGNTNSNNQQTNKPRTSGELVQVGDRVRVLNDHRRLRQTTGVVVKVTSAQATINPDSGGAWFRRYKRNLKIINHE